MRFEQLRQRVERAESRVSAASDRAQSGRLALFDAWRAGWTPGRIVVAGLLAGCSAIDKPTRPSMYDFGPGVPTQSAAAATPVVQTLPPMAIADISTAGGAIENQAVLDRTRIYSLPGEIEHPFANGRWRADMRFSV